MDGQREVSARQNVRPTFWSCTLTEHGAATDRDGNTMRRRIIRLSTAVTLVAIVLFGLPLAIGLTRYFVSEQHRQLHDLATGVAVEVSGDQGLRQLPANVNTDPARQYAVYNPKGSKIAGQAPAGVADLVTAALQGVVSDGQVHDRYAVAVPVTDGNTVVGAWSPNPTPPFPGLSPRPGRSSLPWRYFP